MEAARFNNLVLPMSKKLLHFAFQMLHDTGEAEDAVQEVILKLWKIRDSLENYNSLEAFSMKITRNWCLDRLKAKKPLYIEGYQKGFDRIAADENPQKQMEKDDRLRLLSAVLEKLPEQQRLIIQLRDIEGLEFEQIAEIMDTNVNALRVGLSRARSRMKEELTKYNEYGYQRNTGTAGKIL
jgi:RNA polymerase sigma-70 factor (ECF subfamily)